MPSFLHLTAPHQFLLTACFISLPATMHKVLTVNMSIKANCIDHLTKIPPPCVRWHGDDIQLNAVKLASAALVFFSRGRADRLYH